MSRTIIVLLMICSMLSANSQPAQQYLFTHFGVKEGVAEDIVGTVQQDAKGFIWISTPFMIQRYDGQRFLNFYHKDDDVRSIPAGGIKRMQIDSRNRIWILNGMSTLGYITADDFVYHPVTVEVPKGDYNKTATGLYIDKEDHVFLFFVGHTFLTYNEKANAAAEKYNPFQLPAGWEPLYIWQANDHNYWIGTHMGLIKYNPKEKEMYYRGHKEDEDPIVQHYKDARTVVFAFIDQSNRFWIEGWPDNKFFIKSFVPATGQEISWTDTVGKAMDHYFEVNGVTETKDGSLWISGNGLLAKIINGANRVAVVEKNGIGEYSIQYDVVFSLYEDREQNIWVCTNKGLYMFNPLAQRFRILSNRRPNAASVSADITGFLETSDGRILVSTWGYGVFPYDRQFNPLSVKNGNNKTMPDGGMPWSMVERSNNDIWYGGQDGALAIYHAATGKLTESRPAVFNNSTIRQIATDRSGNLWLGTQGGSLIKWNVVGDSFTLCQRLRSTIARVYIDSANMIWVCTDHNGLFRINANTGQIASHYTNKAPVGRRLRSDGTTDILQYDDSIYVIASDGLNILNLRTQEFTYLTTEKGLVSSIIASLVKDKEGYIWMGTGAGVQCFHPIKRKLSYYNAKDGVNNNSFNTCAAILLKNGSIALGTNHDVLIFEPQKLTATNYHPPRVEIAGFAVMNVALAVDSLTKLKQVELRNFEHSLTIDLTTLSYQNDYNIYYMMEGMDKDWLKVGKLRQAMFNYLRPGKYIFKTACKDENGNMGVVTSLVIYISPPFWKTGWFFCLVALVAGGVLFWIDKKRMQRKETVQKMRADIAANLHEEVNTALSSINILSEMAKLKADSEPQKSKEFIEQIHSKSHNMIISMNDMLWSISPENDSMNKAIERMQEYIDELNTEQNAGIKMSVEDRVKSLKLDMQLRHEAFYLFKESIRGLVNAGADSPRIDVSLDKSCLLYRIQFSTKKCDLQQLNNLLQRQDMANRIHVIKAQLDVQVNKTISIFELKVPIN